MTKYTTCGETGLGMSIFIYEVYLISMFFDLDYINAMFNTHKVNRKIEVIIWVI